MPGMSIAQCQLTAWVDECLKISRINSQHGFQIKQETTPPHSLHALEKEGIRRAFINEVFGMGNDGGSDVESTCARVCMCVFI